MATRSRRRWRPARCGRTEFGDHYPIEMCARQWALSDEIISRDIASVDHALELSYETFCANPVEQMRRVTDFLDIEPVSSDLLQADWEVHGQTSGIRNMNADGISKLSAEDIAAVREVAGPVLDKYGYTPEGP